MGECRDALAGHAPAELVAVFAGGLIGALMRGGLLELLPHDPGSWPWATLAANMLGTATLAWLIFHFHRHHPIRAGRRRATEAGLCGALTTFSTFQLELLGMLDAGEGLLAAGYASASIGAGFALAWLGVALARGYQGATGPGNPPGGATR